MVAAGEVDALVPERVWQELSRGLMEKKPSRMFTVLRDCGALAVLMPELHALWGVPQRAEYHPEIDTGVHTMMVLQMAVRLQAPLAVRFAALTHDLGKGTTPAHILPRHIGHEMRSVDLLRRVCQRWRVPADCKELALLVAKEHGNIHRSLDLNPAATLRLLERCDALRRPERFALALLACECDARGRLGHEEHPYPQVAQLQSALLAAQSVEAGAVLATARLNSDAAEKQDGTWAAEQIRRARQCAIENALKK
jgi:tRNA nucleotidyltransferase (CCA-adding enzyme)